MVPFTFHNLPPPLQAEVNLYLQGHPQSPSARLQPTIIMARRGWVVFAGSELREDAAGLGATPSEALQDFDRHFAAYNPSLL